MNMETVNRNIDNPLTEERSSRVQTTDGSQNQSFAHRAAASVLHTVSVYFKLILIHLCLIDLKLRSVLFGILCNSYL